MTVVKTPLVNAGPQVGLSADVCNADGSGLMWMVRGSREGVKNGTFLRTFFMAEPVSRNLSRNLSR